MNLDVFTEYMLTYEAGNRMLTEFGLDDWTFEIRNLKTFYGKCYHNKKLIGYSEHALKRTDEQIMNTILHEIAHALVGPKQGHGPVWQRKAIEIGAKPTRCGEGSIVAPFKYELRCENENCSRNPKWNRHRLRFNDARCPYCYSELTIYELR